MFRSLINNPTLRRIIRFGIVGTSGFLVDFSITWLIYHFFGISIVVATGIGFCFGATSNYILNRAWTWRSDNPKIFNEFIKFFAVSLIGLAIHYLVLLGALNMPSLRFTIIGFDINNDWTSKLVATAVVMIWNFMANNFYTFRKKTDAMELIFATNNKHKLEEISAALGGGITIKTLAQCGITEDIPETASTLEGNALLKARYVYQRMGVDCFADDTGLEVEALDGAPGVYSARYAQHLTGTSHDSSANMTLLLKNMEGMTNRNAHFRTVIALIRDGKEYLFEGVVEGSITHTPAGTDGFGYDPIFIAHGEQLTFAQMTLEAKNAISHRGRATKALCDFLGKICK